MMRPAGRRVRSTGAKGSSSAAERIRRLLFLVPFVAARPEGVPLPELAERLGVAQGELLAEIDLLCQIGPPSGDPSEFLLLSVEEGRVFVDLPQRLVRPPRLSVQEAYALLLGAQALRGSGVEHHEQPLERAVAKIRRALGAADTQALARIEPSLLLGPEDSAGLVVVPALARAARAKQAVDIDYYSAGHGKSRRRGMDPYGLVNHLGAWYLVGRCHENDEPRLFKCERIGRVYPRSERFKLPDGFDLSRFQEARLRLPTARAGTIKLRFHGEAAVRAAAWPGARKLRGGAVAVSLAMSENEWLVGWLLGFGKEVEVLSPQTLRETLSDRLAKLSAAHS